MKAQLRAMMTVAVIAGSWPMAWAAVAQSLSVEERASRREQALSLLDAPNKIERLTALEDILGGSDTSLKNLASKKVLSGTDVDLKNIVVQYAFSRNSKQHVFVISECKDLRNTNYCEMYMPSTGGAIPMYFVNFDKDTGGFELFSTLSNFYPNDIKNSLTTGRLDGDTLTIDIETVKAGRNHCRGSLKLGNSTRFAGQLYL